MSSFILPAVSPSPSPPGRLDYTSALVRPVDVFTQTVNFISCPSVHPHLYPSVFHEPPSVHLHGHECATTTAYLRILLRDLSIFYIFFSPGQFIFLPSLSHLHLTHFSTLTSTHGERDRRWSRQHGDRSDLVVSGTFKDRFKDNTVMPADPAML